MASSQGGSAPGSGGAFPGTRWSLVARLAEPGSDVPSGPRRRAFEELSLAYWRPVYRTLRTIHRRRREEAEDLTQSFFLGLFEKGTLEGFEADPEVGRFRALLRSLVDGFVHTADRDARRKKRGGDRLKVALDPGEVDALEARIARARGPANDPFDLEWRATLIDGALDDLEREARGPLWRRRRAVFLAYDVEPGDGPQPTYADLARRLGAKPHDVKNDLTAARRRFAELVLERIRGACRDEAEAQDELRALFGTSAPAGGGPGAPA